MYAIKRFLKKLRRIAKYIKLVWKTETWDYSYALEFWKESLLEVKQDMLTGYHATPEVHTKRIDEIVALLTRIQDFDKYTEPFYDAFDKKYGDYEWGSEPVEYNGHILYKVVSNNPNRETPQARKEMANIRKHGEYLYKQDIDRLSLLLKKYLRSFWE